MNNTLIALTLSLGLTTTTGGNISNEVTNTLYDYGVLNTDTEQLTTYELLAPKQVQQDYKTQLQAAKEYAPITKYKFKATSQNDLTNVKDDTDTIEVSETLEKGKIYIVTFKGENLYSISQ